MSSIYTPASSVLLPSHPFLDSLASPGRNRHGAPDPCGERPTVLPQPQEKQHHASQRSREMSQMESIFFFQTCQTLPGNLATRFWRKVLPPGESCGGVGGSGEVDLCKVTHLRDKALSLAPSPSEAGLRSARGAADGCVTRMPGS